jgi:hypothetical protein
MNEARETTAARRVIAFIVENLSCCYARQVVVLALALESKQPSKAAR